MGEKLSAESLAPDQARQLIAREGAQALDIRDDDDFADEHIAGATHASDPDVESLVDDLSEDAPVIVVCADGERSAEVAEELRDKGYDAAHVEGGMDAWSSEKLPLQPAEDYEYEGPRRPGPLGV
jgi:rhodanese-related sulfurtransferase